MATDVLSVLREQLSEAEDQVRRLTTAIAALAGADLHDGSRRGRLHNGVSGGDTGNGSKRTGARPRKAAATIGGHGRKKRTFSAATRAKMAAAQKARWAKRNAGAK